MPTSPSPWSAWRDHFESRAGRARPLVTVDAAAALPEAIRTPLTRTLAIFQRGEVGEGRIAHEMRKSKIFGLDDAYYRSLDLFVAEEGQHAVALARALGALGTPPRENALAEKVFRSARRAVDVRHELLVLLAAEVVAVVFYDALAEGLAEASPELSTLLADLVSDEHEHLDFHTDFFRATLPNRRRSRLAFRTRWWTIASAACATVIVDHRKTFAALNLDKRDLARRVRATIAAVETGVLSGAEAAYGPRQAPGQAGLEPATPGTKNRCSAN